jgi:hypothetical protein
MRFNWRIRENASDPVPQPHGVALPASGRRCCCRRSSLRLTLM